MTRHYSALCSWGAIVDGSRLFVLWAAWKSLVLRPWALVRPLSLASFVLGVLCPWRPLSLASSVLCPFTRVCETRRQGPGTTKDQARTKDEGLGTKDDVAL